VNPAGVDYFATSLPSLLLFAEDPEAVKSRRAEFIGAQLDLLHGQVEQADRRLRSLIDSDPNDLEAVDLQAAAAATRRPAELQPERR